MASRLLSGSYTRPRRRQAVRPAFLDGYPATNTGGDATVTTQSATAATQTAVAGTTTTSITITLGTSGGDTYTDPFNDPW